MQEKNIKKKRIIHSSFLKKLHIILENCEYKSIISWTEKGDKFVIYNKEEFIKIVLPKNYRHSHFSSFLRQLNFYGFKRTCLEKNTLCYFHPEFKRNSVNLLIKKIVKKYSEQQEFITIQQLKDLQSDINKLKQIQNRMKYQITECLVSINNLCSLTQFITNSLFEVKQNISFEAKRCLISVLRLIFGMNEKRQPFFYQIIELIFPESEINQFSTIISPTKAFSPITLINYMSSIFPSTKIQQYKEVQEYVNKLIEEHMQNDQLNLLS